jgi:hypothetical protein
MMKIISACQPRVEFYLRAVEHDKGATVTPSKKHGLMSLT